MYIELSTHGNKNSRENPILQTTGEKDSKIASIGTIRECIFEIFFISWKLLSIKVNKKDKRRF